MLSITGNLELSKEILHKQINFISPEEGRGSGSDSLYGGKNYGVDLIKKFHVMGVGVRDCLHKFEERFMTQQDQDFLAIILDSMSKG